MIPVSFLKNLEKTHLGRIALEKYIEKWSRAARHLGRISVQSRLEIDDGHSGCGFLKLKLLKNTTLRDAAPHPPLPVSKERCSLAEF